MEKRKRKGFNKGPKNRYYIARTKNGNYLVLCRREDKTDIGFWTGIYVDKSGYLIRPVMNGYSEYMYAMNNFANTQEEKDAGSFKPDEIEASVLFNQFMPNIEKYETMFIYYPMKSFVIKRIRKNNVYSLFVTKMQKGFNKCYLNGETLKIYSNIVNKSRLDRDKKQVNRKSFNKFNKDKKRVG